MRFDELALRGAFLIHPDRREDNRGYFARAWCRTEAQEHGLDAAWVQTNVSFNHRRGTLRGLHFQRPPYQEVKLVQCIAGAIFDVMVDLRQGSPTFRQWFGTELTADNLKMFYIPKGFAHGYLTLTDGARVLYQVSEYYQPEHQGGYRYDDPAFGIKWPTAARELTLSERDAAMPTWKPDDCPLPG